MSRPPPCACMCRAAAWAQKKPDFRSIVRTRSQSAWVTSINRRLLEVTQADWDRVLTIDLKSGFFCAQAAARHMQAQGGGRLIFIGSVHAHASVPQFAPYAASKIG